MCFLNLYKFAFYVSQSQGSEGQTLGGTTKRERASEDQPVPNCNPKLNDELEKKKMRYSSHADGCQDDNLHSKSSDFEEWVDEPDVCMFCDDGVGEGDKLLWYNILFCSTFFLVQAIFNLVYG